MRRSGTEQGYSSDIFNIGIDETKLPGIGLAINSLLKLMLTVKSPSISIAQTIFARDLK